MTGKWSNCILFAVLTLVLIARIASHPHAQWIMKDGIPARADGRIIFESDEQEENDYDYGDEGEKEETTVTSEPIVDVDDNADDDADMNIANCANSTFCEDAPHYPEDVAQAVLRMNKDLKMFSGMDMVPDVAHRLNKPPDEVSLCSFREQVVYPKIAKNKHNKWRYILNHQDFSQGIRIETCEMENCMCNLIDGSTQGFVAICKQKYIYRQLLSISNGKIEPDMFRFPASCCCHIKYIWHPFGRMGTNSSDKLPITKIQIETKDKAASN